uniref:BHLH domain-containing protein n=1 Tax=Ananas comosus var. bracteatus TaxID=296719 RepID=A0A6V7PB05_ANACO|nr:unnamed protein product [Ananas comosus var. bracteatus]
MDDPSWDLFSFLQEVDEQEHTLHFALSPPPPPSPTLPCLRSAFSTYARVGSCDIGGLAAGRHVGSAAVVNVHRRLFGFIRRIGDEGVAVAGVRAAAEAEEGAGVGQSRGFRHMMRERWRRERMSQGYADLYAMLSSSSKGDKISVVKAAAARVRELRYQKEQLQRRNAELAVVAAAQRPATAAVAINLTIANCSTPMAMDALTAALQCLKLMELKITAVRSSFSGKNLSVIVGVETKVRSHVILVHMRLIGYVHACFK